ncbi:MAG: thioredoxin domain-containing protein [Microscillaceae bacterium]|jgi:hypothetical protein|nr:thioredoxin domain-containing protein [Microscillaceae bacterium]
MTANTTREPNRLIHSGSPYLLQHAYNPVDWFPWGEEALQKAQTEDKPIIVSIGYSACHWCHVMERESFENEQIATLMNQHFVCIKVDREERPDVDAVYMDAVQTMGLQGGWPLNAFLTPQAKPFYAGTYFPPQNWANLLVRIAQVFQENRAELEESAEQFKNSIAVSELKKYALGSESADFEALALDEMFDKLAANFDTQLGGMQKAPKFPMPNLWAWVLQYSQTTQSAARAETAFNQVKLTLKEIYQGGIYDQIGGGWARYSVDGEWFAPHFEKMLYDNGQLIGLYADIYNLSKDAVYKQAVYQSIAFIKREMLSEEGGFYAALDADSEGVEGKFYTWTYKELAEIWTDAQELQLFCDYYQVLPVGNWEHGVNILCRRKSDEEFANLNHLSLPELQTKIKDWQKKLLKIRTTRIRPGLDDKILTAWNGLMLKGLIDAYRVFDEESFLELALENAYFIKNKLFDGEKLFRNYKNGKADIIAYLEDYAQVIEAMTALYQATFDLQWLHFAQKLTEYTLTNFYDTEEGMFFFTDQNAEKLIARKKEIFDNVTPASNSAMAKNLYFLGLLLDNQAYIKIARRMVSQVKPLLLRNIEYLANWGQLYIYFTQATAEIALVGEDAMFFRKELDKKYYPNKVIVGSFSPSQALPLLENRGAGEDSLIYVCFDKTCQLPVNSVARAWEQIYR